MSTPCFVGTRDRRRPHLVCVRYIAGHGHPNLILPALRRIWSHTAGRNTTVMLDLLLHNDWNHLEPAPAPDPADVEVTGVGVPCDPPATPATTRTCPGPEPVTRFPLHQAGALDIGWIYLIDPATATIAVHDDTGELVHVHPLRPPSPPTPRHAPPAGRRRRIVRGSRPVRRAGPVILKAAGWISAAILGMVVLCAGVLTAPFLGDTADTSRGACPPRCPTRPARRHPPTGPTAGHRQRRPTGGCVGHRVRGGLDPTRPRHDRLRIPHPGPARPQRRRPHRRQRQHPSTPPTTVSSPPCAATPSTPAPATTGAATATATRT